MFWTQAIILDSGRPLNGGHHLTNSSSKREQQQDEDSGINDNCVNSKINNNHHSRRSTNCQSNMMNKKNELVATTIKLSTIETVSAARPPLIPSPPSRLFTTRPILRHNNNNAKHTSHHYYISILSITLLIMLISSHSEDNIHSAPTILSSAFASTLPTPSRDQHLLHSVLPRDLLRDETINRQQDNNNNIVLPIYSQSAELTAQNDQQYSNMPQSAPLLSGSASVPSLSTMSASGSASAQGGVTTRTVNPGDRINIPCSLANPGGSIQFAKDDQPIILDSGCAHCQLDISNDGQASLTINRVNSKDEGHWQCWRLDENGNIKQKISIIQLVVTNSPELPILTANGKELIGGSSSNDATMTVKENEIVEFKCIIKGASPPIKYVHWMLDSAQNITHLSHLMMEYSGNNNNYLTQSILKLNATKAMNLKSISCLSDHQLWTAPMTVTAFLNVLYEPSFTISREPGFGIPVSEGMSVMLKCEIDSNPSSNPIWIKDAEKQPNTNNQQQHSDHSSSSSTIPTTSGGGGNADNSQLIRAEAEPTVLETQEDGSVIFWPVQKSDSGWYRCKTENKYGNFSSFGYYLNVRAGPSTQPSAGAAALPVATPPQTQISSASSPYQTSSQPSAASINQQLSQLQQQQYAPNQRPVVTPNQISASNNAPPNQFQPLAHRQINNNNHYQAQQADALRSSMSPYQQAPSSTSQQQQQQSNNNKWPRQETTAAQSEVRQDYQPQQRAPQQQQSNGLQSMSSECNNAGAPVIEQTNSTVTGILNRPLSLSVRFCCNPKPRKVFWIHRHLAMIPGRIFGPYVTRELWTTWNAVFCYTSTFEIEAAKTDDIGTVYFVVGNERGLADAQITINLTTRGSDMIPSGKYLSGSSGSLIACSPNVMLALLSTMLSLGCYFVCFKQIRQTN